MRQFIGEIRLFGGIRAPRDWAFCEGQILSTNEFPALFAVINNYYGGNGISNFALPDLRGRTAIGSGQAPGLSYQRLGEEVGFQEIRLTYEMLPSHKHTASVEKAEVKIPVSTASASSSSPRGTFLTVQGSNFYSTTPAPGKFYGPTLDDFSGSPEVLNRGLGKSFDIQQPFLNLRYMIALEGQFPARN